MSIVAGSSLTNYVNDATVVVDGKILLPRASAESTVVDLLRQRGHNQRDARNLVNAAMSATADPLRGFFGGRHDVCHSVS